MRAVRWPTLVATLSCLIGCLGDPVGPRGTLVLRRLSPLDSVLVGAPGRPLPTAITFEALDGDGRPIRDATVQWTVAGTNALVEQAVGATDSRGQVSAVWVLGTRASDRQTLAVHVQVGKHSAEAGVAATARPVEVSSVAFSTHDTTAVKLGVATAMAAQATDPFGNRFVPAGMRFASLDTTLCSVDSLGVVRAIRRGFGRIVVVAGSSADTAWVHPTQVVQAIRVSPDTLRFHSLGQTATLSVQLLDDQGLYVHDSLPADSVPVNAVVRVQPGRPYAVQSVSNGATPLILRAGIIAQAVQVLVDQRGASVKVSANRTTFDALGDTAQLTASVSDSLGIPLANQALAYSSGDTGVAGVGQSGLITSRSNGSTWIYARAGNGVADSVQIVVAQLVARVVAMQDSILLDALQAVLPTKATAIDRLGSRVTAVPLTYATGAPSVVTVDARGNVRAIANGATVVTAAYGGDTAYIAVRVAQRPVRVLASSDTVRFVALGETQAVAAVAVDSLGHAVSGAVVNLVIGDTTVVRKLDAVTLRAKLNGSTQVTFEVAGLPAQLGVTVAQVADTVVASVGFSQPIATLQAGSPFPVSCDVRDRNGYAVVGAPVAVHASSAATVSGTSCGSLTVARSGLDSLYLTSGPAKTAIPIAVALPPVVTPSLGDYLSVDSMPSSTGPWAPSARRNTQGQIEVYFTGYYRDTVNTDQFRGNLHRLVSNDGVNFQYDGVVLQHNDSLCSLEGSGIENIDIVPRADGSGWRMFYAAGSFTCYGWQVFSAVSNDGRTWVRESGVRLSNGGGVAVPVPWPAGEGMVTELLSSGQWRMIVSTYEHLTPYENKFQITEWRSPDQLNWTYVGPVFTTRQMGPEGQRSVYSPTIKEFAPGLWRMIFTADNRDQPGGASYLWSAVSTDKINWELEGQLIGSPGSNFLYCTLVDDRLIFMRQDGTLPRRLAIATVLMP